ncbi:MAG: T9SS type A sorting domain-containing protein [Saprospiraceae bacterium]|nr:T9SS type A sorting domain-containing protein [Saprospiraceae bacterium]
MERALLLAIRICLILACQFALMSVGMAQNQCCNVLTNGDFELGDVGFTSDLNQSCLCSGESYCVGTNFQTKCSGWPNLGDHTSGGGNFLIIDGHQSSPADVWVTTVSLVPGVTHCFSFWTANVYSNTFELGLAVDGVLLPGAVFTVQPGPVWTQFSFSWVASSGSTIAIRQLTGDGQRDFGIDDIEFGPDIQAGFTWQPVVTCGMQIDFTNQSVGPSPLVYAWNFGEPGNPPNTSNLEDPSHAYSSCGNFDVCLTVSFDQCMATYCDQVTSSDVIPPVLNCPPDALIQCDEDQSPAFTGIAVATDNCTANPTIIYSDMVTGSLPCDAIIERSWEAMDSCGNVDMCEQLIFIIDDKGPLLNGCPSDTMVKGILSPTGACEAYLVLTSPTGVDNCDPSITLTNNFNGSADASGTYPQGATTVIWTATDDCMNTSTCSFVVSVECDSICVCYSDLMFQYGSAFYPVTCDPHVGNIPLFPCQALDVSLSGFFGCINSSTGEVCDATTVTWELLLPDSSLQSGISTNTLNLLFPASGMPDPGTYCLTLSTGCSGSSDSCICKIVWIRDACESCACSPNEPASTNLVTNGNFSFGDNYFGSDLAGPVNGQCSTCQSGTYCVGTNFTEKCSGWPDVCDHTPPQLCTGNFLLIDGDDNGIQPVVWRQSVGILPCKTYCLSFWTASAYDLFNQNFDLNIVIYDGNNQPTVIGTVAVVQTIPPWSQHIVNWNCPCNAVGPFTLSIEQVSSGDYRDFGLDDICLTQSMDQDSCCKDLDLFCSNLQNAVSVAVNNDSCKATLSVGNLGGCNDEIEFVDWGDGVVSTGPFPSGSMVMHSYVGSDAYEVCYLGIERDSSGQICLEKLICDTITLVCGTCCTDSSTFFAAAPNIQTNGILGDCFISYTAEGLDDCWQISYLWGDQPATWSPAVGNNMTVSHAYTSATGNYTVCYRLEEVDPSGAVCWSFEKCEDVYVICPCIDPPQGMVAWWPLDEASGTTVADIMGPNSGSVTGPAINSGGIENPGIPLQPHIDGQFYFTDPGQNYVVVPSDPSLDFGTTGSFAIDTWINKVGGNTPTDFAPIVDKHDPLSSGSGYMFFVNGTYHLGFFIGSQQYTSVGTLNPQQWHHVAVTVDRSTSPGSVTLYIDGQQDGSPFVNLASSESATSSYPLLIGSTHLSPMALSTEYALDEIEIFDRALDPDVIESLFLADTFGKCKDFVNVVDELPEGRNVRLFPNPTSGDLTIHFDGPVARTCQLQLMDLLGRSVKTLILNTGEQGITFSLNELPPGLYMVKMMREGVPLWVRKVIKQ